MGGRESKKTSVETMASSGTMGTTDVYSIHSACKDCPSWCKGFMKNTETDVHCECYCHECGRFVSLRVPVSSPRSKPTSPKHSSLASLWSPRTTAELVQNTSNVKIDSEIIDIPEL